jgi:hypothetical protein
MALVHSYMFYSAAFESKSRLENIIDIVELDAHNRKLRLMVWLAKLANL